MAGKCRDLKRNTERTKIPVLTVGKQSEEFGQQLAIPLSGEKKINEDC